MTAYDWACVGIALIVGGAVIVVGIAGMMEELR